MFRSIALAAACLVLSSCAKPPGMATAQAPSLAPSSNVFLRNSFDTDPSSYIGRFVPEGLSALDESAGMALACSKHITWRRVDGGGVKYTEILTTSSEVSARLGVPLVASAKGQGSSQGLVRVEYELIGKMIGEIADPEAFNACCAKSPDQCTTRYIGEFLEGKGAVYHLSANSASGSAGGASPSVSGEASFSHDTNWQRAVEFPNPVYFAFKTAGTTHEQSTGTSCEDWKDQLPTKPGGSYVLGVSRKDAKTETAARNRAMINAANTAAMSGLITFTPPAEGEEGELTEMPMMDGLLTPEDWCVELVRTEKGDRFQAKVLAWVPEQDK